MKMTTEPSADKAGEPLGLAAERPVRPGAEARWYCLSREGMATLCTGEEDAKEVAAESWVLYPQNGPYRAVQMVDFARVTDLLAGKWQAEADSDKSISGAERRATLRACADTLRMLCEVRFEDCPHAAPHRYCAECPVKPCPIGLDQPKAPSDTKSWRDGVR
jgi:hypothetical protein